MQKYLMILYTMRDGYLGNFDRYLLIIVIFYDIIQIEKMFSKCFHEHSEHQKSRLFKRLFDILYTIRTQLFQEAY